MTNSELLYPFQHLRYRKARLCRHHDHVAQPGV